jgi:hypothetical protein
MTTETLLPNAHWRPVFWEPVSGTGERLMVGALVEWDGRVSGHRFIRDEVLDCLYGKASKGIKALIETGLQSLSSLGADAVLTGKSAPNLFGLEPGPLRHTHAKNLADALRTAALLYSSLTNLDKLDDMEEVDAPSQEEGNRRFTTDVRDRVLSLRPDLGQYFGRTAVLIEGGEHTRFGFVSPRAILHFGVLSPVRQPTGLRDARARLWELYRAQEISGIELAGLIFGTPSEDDPTLSPRQIDAMRRNLKEIEQEADTYKMKFFPVTTAQAGAETLIAYA